MNRNAKMFLLMVLVSLGCARSPSSSHDSRNSREDKGKQFLEAARPFFESLVNENYGQAYDRMSHWASENVDPRQFALDSSTNEIPEKIEKLTRSEFVERMNRVQELYGPFRRVADIYVETTDADILSGKANDSFERTSILFAIGAMPESVPAEIRVASIRGELTCVLKPEQTANHLASVGVHSVEQLRDPDDYPNLKLKIVLVKEFDGTLKVGYFEIVPPSILD